MDEIESTDVVTEETGDVTEEVADTVTEPTEGAKVEKPKETLEQKEARLTRELKQLHKKLGKDGEPAPKAKTDGLDDTALDYLDLKGVSEAEDIAIVESIMKKTGMSARDAIKDEYVVAKLAANKQTREVRDATPSSTKRNGATVDNVAAAVARFEKDGVMPDNFELRNKVVDALVAKDTKNAPSWH